MANAMVALANLTLGSAQSTVTFSNIPTSGYRDLRLVIDLIPSGSLGDIYGRFNGDTGSNYPWVEAGGNGSSTYSGASTSTGNLIGYLVGSGRTTIQFDVLDFSVTDKHKSSLTRQSTAGETAVMRANRWANTGAVTSVAISCQSSSFGSGSTFALYGIVSA